VPASPDALREAAGHWKAALVSHDVVFEEFCVRRDKALADRTRRKRAAYRAALDVRRQFDEAASEVARADLALRAEARTLQETVSRQLALSLERGRLAQERALAKLDQALTDRVKTFAATRARIEADLFSFVSEDAANVDDASKKRREIVAEMASALAELARRNESAIEAQTGALRELWRRSDPAALARDLDASERGKLLEERLRERDVLLETSRDVARLRDELEALRKRAPLD
jgi:hypothetical protein